MDFPVVTNTSDSKKYFEKEFEMWTMPEYKDILRVIMININANTTMKVTIDNVI